MKIFLSYPFRDHDQIAPLVDLLVAGGHQLVNQEFRPGSDWKEALSSELRASEVVLAFVTSNNPNVFYEIGLATGVGLPIVVAAPATVTLPDDILSAPFVHLTQDPARDGSVLLRRLEEIDTRSPARPKVYESAVKTLEAAQRDPEVLAALSPAQFEVFVGEALKEKGFRVIPRDEGQAAKWRHDADFYLEAPDRDGAIVVEVKKTANQGMVSVDAVRQILEQKDLVRGSVALLVATAFTPSALALAAGTGVILLTLRDLVSARTREDVLDHKQAIK